jgi:hypothetical protein
MSFAALGLLAYETRGAAAKLLSRDCAIAAGLMVLAFGGYSWSAASGMEVVPCAWLLMRGARRVSEWAELAAPEHTKSRLVELLVLSVVAPCLRPECALASLLIACAIAAFGNGRQRAWGLLALASPLLPTLIYWLGTGEARSTTMQVKWLFSLAPDPLDALGETLSNAQYLATSIAGGELHSAVFLPTGGRILFWLALPALAVLGHVRRARFRAVVIAVVALGILIPCTYQTFLWNRLRYLWPFAAAWFVALAALADAAGELLARVSPALSRAPAMLAGTMVGALLGHLPFAVEDLAGSASGIFRQQVALGVWAREELPKASRLGVNDTGAIAYFSERRVFDIVGLTTSSEGRHWVAGPGARWEHYERLPPQSLPTHFIVYPDWLGMSALLGEWLAERVVEDSTILGGPRMVVHVADYSRLRTGDAPALDATRGLALIDRVDVADLDSELEHAYRVETPDGTHVVESNGRIDGARARRTRDDFLLRVTPGGRLIARIGSERAVRLVVRASGQQVGELVTAGMDWEELALDLPEDLRRARTPVSVAAAEGSDFVAFHYWSFERPPPGSRP